MSTGLTDDRRWRWGWSWWLGVHYGPIPVGILIGVPILLKLW